MSADPETHDAHALQLRILSGMHAGARAPLEGDEYTLGSLDDCDFVLMDSGVQPRHARLSRADGGWQVDWVAEEGEEAVLAPMRLEAGKAVPLGPVVIAVDEAQAPWPTLEQLVLVPHAPALEPNLPPPLARAPSRGLGERVRGAFGRRVTASVAIAATAGLSALAMVAWPMQLDRGARQGGIPATALEPGGSQKQAIEAALKDLGLTERTRIERAGEGWMVRASVMNPVDSESLSAALSRIQPRPGLKMLTEHDLGDEVADMLLRIAPEYRGSVSLRYLGEARFRLEGRMVKAAERDKLLRALAAALPQVREFENGVVTGEEDADKMLADLRSRGWAIESAWNKGRLEIEVRLQQREVPEWERALLGATRAGLVPFDARLIIAQPAVAVTPGPAARLPFQIRGVVGGEMPYVLLADGAKLSPGGTWQGWRLAAVSASELVFDNGARRAVIPR